MSAPQQPPGPPASSEPPRAFLPFPEAELDPAWEGPTRPGTRNPRRLRLPLAAAALVALAGAGVTGWALATHGSSTPAHAAGPATRTLTPTVAGTPTASPTTSTPATPAAPGTPDPTPTLPTPRPSSSGRHSAPRGPATVTVQPGPPVTVVRTQPPRTTQTRVAHQPVTAGQSLTCPARATITAHGSGTGSNTMVFSWPGGSKTLTGTSVTYTTTAGAGRYSVTDTDTGGHPSVSMSQASAAQVCR